MAKRDTQASNLTGFVYPTGGGNDIGVYKQPMTNADSAAENVVDMSGNPVDMYNISVGGLSKGNYKGVNPQGTGEMRGYGAATKGRKTSGKMG
jgi:hypothetical protein